MSQDAHLCAQTPIRSHTVESSSAARHNGGMAPASGLNRVLLHVSRSRRLTAEPDNIYYLEAAGGATIIRKRGRRTIQDVRPLAEVVAAMPYLYRIHDKWAVNLRRIREIRLQSDGRDWEVVMHPPVNRVLPVSRRRLEGLMRRFGG